MSDPCQPPASTLAVLAGFADGSQTLLQQCLAQWLQQPDSKTSLLHKLRRASRETELWLRRYEHHQCVCAGFFVPNSGRLGTIAKFRGRLDSTIRLIERAEPVDMPRLLEHAQTLLDRLSM